MDDTRLVDIARLGADGDGVADTAAGPLYVPFALPGESVRVAMEGEARARLLEVVRASGERIAPACRHFQACGGCVAQHMSRSVYERWRAETVREAFHHRGIEAQVLPLIAVPSGSRRRAFLGVERDGARVTIGFREEGCHTLVDMAECPVLAPEIVAALPRLREMARIAMADRQGGRLLVSLIDHGLDISFDNGRKDLSADELARLAALAEAAGLMRLVVAGEPVVLRGPTLSTVGGVAVDVPPGLFVQAAAAAEQAIVDLALAAMPRKVRRIGDLFCGVGTLAFPLARHAEVAAFDSDRRAIAALTAAHKRTAGLRPIAARTRDLFREPLSRKELEGFDMVVLDPPRAGARAQCEALARSSVPVVVAVSCNPATLARDARILIDGGYELGPVTPIDQFLLSAHVEAVAVLRRQPARASRRAT